MCHVRPLPATSTYGAPGGDVVRLQSFIYHGAIVASREGKAR
jgi:hypothetical protein